MNGCVAQNLHNLVVAESKFCRAPPAAKRSSLKAGKRDGKSRIQVAVALVDLVRGFLRNSLKNRLESLRKTPTDGITPIVPGSLCDNWTQSYSLTQRHFC